METRVVREDILNKVKTYDSKHRTNFAEMLAQKFDNANDRYTRGVLHGLCLALAHLNIISNEDAIALLEEVHNVSD